MVIKLLFQIQYSRLTQVFCFFLIILYYFVRVLQLLYISRNIKVGRFSSRDEVFIWEILSRPCRDPALNKQDSAQPERDKKRPGFI